MSKNYRGRGGTREGGGLGGAGAPPDPWLDPPLEMSI